MGRAGGPGGHLRAGPCVGDMGPAMVPKGAREGGGGVQPPPPPRTSPVHGEASQPLLLVHSGELVRRSVAWNHSSVWANSIAPSSPTSSFNDQKGTSGPQKAGASIRIFFGQPVAASGEAEGGRHPTLRYAAVRLAQSPSRVQSASPSSSQRTGWIPGPLGHRSGERSQVASAVRRLHRPSHQCCRPTGTASWGTCAAGPPQKEDSHQWFSSHNEGLPLCTVK